MHTVLSGRDVVIPVPCVLSKRCTTTFTSAVSAITSAGSYLVDSAGTLSAANWCANSPLSWFITFLTGAAIKAVSVPNTLIAHASCRYNSGPIPIKVSPFLPFHSSSFKDVKGSANRNGCPSRGL